MSKQKAIVTTSNTLAVLIVIGIVIAANIIVGKIRGVRVDMTEEKLYSLSEGTKTVLGELGDDVSLKFFYSKSGEDTPIFLKQYAQRVQDLLHEYEVHSGNRVVIERFDPKPDSDEEDLAPRGQRDDVDPVGELEDEEIELAAVARMGFVSCRSWKKR